VIVCDSDLPTSGRRQVLFNIPYFFGAIAKINYDWLIRAQPPTMWFAQ
jgi:hypothetical protein